MKILLDTHTFLWFIGGNLKLSNTARKLIEDQANDRILSVASIWEIAIKVNIGKLKLNMSFTSLVKDHIQGNAINLLTILPEHLDCLLLLPFHHKDPFDRLIISQGKTEDTTILSKDEIFDEYNEIKRLW